MNKNEIDNLSDLLAMSLALNGYNIPSDDTVDKLAQLYEVRPLYSRDEIIKKVRQWIGYDGTEGKIQDE